MFVDLAIHDLLIKVLCEFIVTEYSVEIFGRFVVVTEFLVMP